MNEINSVFDLKLEIENNPAVLVYFYNESCAPCISLRPKVIEMAHENFPKMTLIFINSIYMEITSVFGIYENPTLLVFFENKEYIRASKYISISQLQQNIDRYYSLVF